MRIPAGVGDFVHGKYFVPQNPVVPGGIGDLVPGAFAVPQTPVGAGMGDLVPGAFSVPQTPVGHGLGYLLSNASLWPVPQNSVIEGFESGGISYDAGVSGLGCGCGGKCKNQCGGGCSGLGTLATDFTQFTTDLTSGNILQALQDPLSGIPVYVYLGGIVVLAMVLGGGGKKQR